MKFLDTRIENLFIMLLEKCKKGRIFLRFTKTNQLSFGDNFFHRNRNFFQSTKMSANSINFLNKGLLRSISSWPKYFPKITNKFASSTGISI